MTRVQPGVFQAAVLSFSGFTGIHYGTVFSDSDTMVVCLLCNHSSSKLHMDGRSVLIFHLGTWMDCCFFISEPQPFGFQTWFPCFKVLKMFGLKLIKNTFLTWELLVLLFLTLLIQMKAAWKQLEWSFPTLLAGSLLVLQFYWVYLIPWICFLSSLPVLNTS